MYVEHQQQSHRIMVQERTYSVRQECVHERFEVNVVRHAAGLCTKHSVDYYSHGINLASWAYADVTGMTLKCQLRYLRNRLTSASVSEIDGTALTVRSTET